MIENDHELDTWWERFVQERSRAIAKSMGGKQAASRMAPQAPVPIPEFSK